MSEKKTQTCQEKNPIGTEVIVIEDCRRIKRATNKKGIIVKYLHYIIPKEVFPLNFNRKGVKYRMKIQDWDEDLLLDIPIIKYSRFGRIRGDCCFWISLIEKIKGDLKKDKERKFKEDLTYEKGLRCGNCVYYFCDEYDGDHCEIDNDMMAIKCGEFVSWRDVLRLNFAFLFFKKRERNRFRG